jgi:hypothetical protein
VRVAGIPKKGQDLSSAGFEIVREVAVKTTTERERMIS